MDETPNDYHISFFKPTTPQAVANRNMVVWFVLIWFIAIFGFQFLLWLIEKPTPEPAYTTFERVWPIIKDGAASEADFQEFGQATLSVLGKIALSDDEKAVLDNAMSWTLWELTDESERNTLIANIRNFEKLKAEITELSDQNYISAKKELSDQLSPILKISNLDVRSKILPLGLVSADIEKLSEVTVINIPAVMKKYLVHNQSFLTDYKFMGFPFHYFYTAIFLLILFVGLCWLYCVKTDQINAKLEIID